MTGILIGFLVSQGLFARTYGRDTADQAHSIVQTRDGGYAVAGFSVGAGWISDILALKTDPSGNLEWARTFGGDSNAYAYSMVQTRDGGYALTGFMDNDDYGRDYLVIKLDSLGEKEWIRSFAGWGTYPVVYSVIQTSDGGYALAGTKSGGDFVVLRMDSLGILEWGKAFSGTGYAWSMIQTSDRGFAVAGHAFAGLGGYDFLLLKLDSSGALEWARAFGGDSTDYAYSVIQTTDGGYVLAGFTHSFRASTSFWDALLIRLDSSGSPEWSRTFGGGDWFTESYSVIQTQDGGYAVSGATYSFGEGGYDLLALKISATGDLQWARTFGGTQSEWARSIVQTLDGGYAMAGHTESFGTGDWAFLVMKLDSNGDYPDCASACSLTVTVPPLNTVSPVIGVQDYAPDTSTLNITVETPDLTVIDACSPSVMGESDWHDPKPVVTCSPVLGGALFISGIATGIRIYSPDGRLVHTGVLKEGKNFVRLRNGVWLWVTHDTRGKALVTGGSR